MLPRHPAFGARLLGPNSPTAPWPLLVVDEQPTVSPLSVVHVLHVPGADGNADVADRQSLVLAKQNVIINDIRLRVLALQELTPPVGRALTHTRLRPCCRVRKSIRSIRRSHSPARICSSSGSA